ncbi:MAG: TIGR02300 family protein [Pseudomonadota bacterium]
MAAPEAGTKRVCPETGKKFYDLNADPIVSPYTGKSYPLSFFDAEKQETAKQTAKSKPAEKETKEDDDEELPEDAPEIVSLEEADGETESEDNLPDLEDDEDAEIELDDDDDTFLETDEDDDDMSDLVVDSDDEDKDV